MNRPRRLIVVIIAVVLVFGFMLGSALVSKQPLPTGTVTIQTTGSHAFHNIDWLDDIIVSANSNTLDWAITTRSFQLAEDGVGVGQGLENLIEGKPYNTEAAYYSTIKASLAFDPNWKIVVDDQAKSVVIHTANSDMIYEFSKADGTTIHGRTHAQAGKDAEEGNTKKLKKPS